jgi:hypothetical protein
VAWEQAYQALGAPADHIDVAAASDVRLRALVERHDREIAWAPPFAESEQREAHQAAEAYRVQAELLRAEARAAESERRAALEARAGDYEQLAGLHAARAGKLDQVTEAYDRWHTHTEPVRLAAEQARTELDRRHPAPGAQAESTRAPDPWAGRGRAAEREYDQPDLDVRQEQAAEHARTQPVDGQLQLDVPDVQVTPDIQVTEGPAAEQKADRAQQRDQDHDAARQVEPEPEPTAQAERDRKPARQVDGGQQELDLDLDLPEPCPEPRLSGAQIDQALHTARSAEKVLTERAAEVERAPEQEAAELDRRVDYQQQQEAEQARVVEQQAPQIVATPAAPRQ